MSSREMTCFEVSINGLPHCISGIDGNGVMSLILTRVQRDPERRPKDLEDEAWSLEELNFSVTGLITSDHSHEDEVIEWQQRPIDIGDEITVKILKSLKCDAPDSRRPIVNDVDRPTL